MYFRCLYSTEFSAKKIGMLRLKSRLKLLRCVTEPRSVVPVKPALAGDKNTQSTTRSDGLVVPELRMDRLARYIPTDSSSFMVEDHRLTESERATQTLSTYLPWVIFGVFATVPFLVMKYNLEKLSKASHSPSDQPMKAGFRQRAPFRVIQFRDMPEVIERRKPTLVGMFSDNYHSSILLNVFREVDKLFEHYNVETGVVVYDVASADNPDFTSKYPGSLGPYCQLVMPGDRLVDYEGPFTVESLLEFLVGHDKISPDMRESSRASDSRLRLLQQCVFRRRFIDGKKWTVEDVLSVDSLEAALVRCVGTMT